MRKTDIAKKLYASAVNADWDTFDSLIHPDFRVLESPGLEYAGEYKGVEGFKQVVHDVYHHFKRFEIETQEFSESDAHVIVLVKIKGQGKKTDEEFESDLLELIRFEGDKVIEIRPYYWDQNLINRI